MRGPELKGIVARRLASGALAVAMFGAAAVPVAAAAPAPGRITRGDVVAAFQARTTGGYLNQLDGRTGSAPVRGFLDGRISFFGDGLTYCSLDWHYLGVTLFADGGHRAASAYLRQTDVEFLIDGSGVSETVSAIKPFVGTDSNGDFGISRGAFFAPGSISDGEHQLETDIHTPDGDESLVISFSMSPDAC